MPWSFYWQQNCPRLCLQLYKKILHVCLQWDHSAKEAHTSCSVVLCTHRSQSRWSGNQNHSGSSSPTQHLVFWFSLLVPRQSRRGNGNKLLLTGWAWSWLRKYTQRAQPYQLRLPTLSWGHIVLREMFKLKSQQNNCQPHSHCSVLQ